uniref:acetyl-CoA carboxylase beta subunit n=1 Tax=Lonicera tatarinowii TaxID=1914886 RepID=UPI0025A9CA27|nr:acetyl-CoA carboxylase beta subunit [Lonicera tatarinowii]WID87333.1 acetyl-CoA carboxylase beta subunit [Lonicera tatarinowii]
MKKNNLRSDVFVRHQGVYSLKKLWFHLMLLDFGRDSGLRQSEEDLLIVRAKAQPDSESDPEEHNSESDPEEYTPERACDRLKAFYEESERERRKEFFELVDYHLEIFFNELFFFGVFRDWAGGLGDFEGDFRGRYKAKKKAIAMIRALVHNYCPNGDPSAIKDPEKIKKFNEAFSDIVERYKNGDLRDPREKVKEEIRFELRLELNELDAKYFPKDDPGAINDSENIDKYFRETFRILERYSKDPSYGGDPQEDDSDYGSDTDGPDYGSDTDGPDYGSDTDGPDYGSDTDGHFYGYGYGNDPDALESDPEDYLQKKRNPGGDYLQIDRYPEDTCFKIERDPQKIDRYIEEPYLDYGSNPQKDDPSYGGDPQEDDSDSGSDPQEDDSDSGSDPNPRENYTHKYKHLWLMCDECYTLNYRRFLKEKLYICEGCGFHLKMNSSERLKLLIDPDTWDPMNEKMASLDPIEFHSEEDPYIDRVNSYQKKTGLTEAIQTGLGQLNGIPIAMGVMEFGFMGGSMGSVVGEKITRLVEYATNQSLPLIIVCASGGARMQEGSLSLMQMAKISSSLYDFQTNKKLFYVSVLTSPTTGGVTASFGMLGDVIFAEPDAYIAFAGKRVIEQTLNKEVPEGSQETEYLFEKGLFDLVVPRKKLKSILNKLFGSHGFFPLTLNQNHSSITEH